VAVNGEKNEKLCDICKYEHADLPKNVFKLEQEALKEQKMREFIEEFKRIKKRVTGSSTILTEQDIN
jgi:hypothetical protein